MVTWQICFGIYWECICCYLVYVCLLLIGLSLSKSWVASYFEGKRFKLCSVNKVTFKCTTLDDHKYYSSYTCFANEFFHWFHGDLHYVPRHHLTRPHKTCMSSNMCSSWGRSITSSISIKSSNSSLVEKYHVN